jgi:hypothetical protein
MAHVTIFSNALSAAREFEHIIVGKRQAGFDGESHRMNIAIVEEPRAGRGGLH